MLAKLFALRLGDNPEATRRVHLSYKGRAREVTQGHR